MIRMPSRKRRAGIVRPQAWIEGIAQSPAGLPIQEVVPAGMFEFANKQVSDAMSAPAVAVRDDASLAEVEAVLETHGFNACPVVDAGGCLVGIVSSLDLLRACRLRPDSPLPHYQDIMNNSPVSKHMSASPVTVQPELPLSRVLQRMLDLGNTSFPVVISGVLVGVITRRDVLRILRETSSAGAHQ